MRLLHYERDRFAQIQAVEGTEEVQFSIEKQASIPVHLRFPYKGVVWDELMEQIAFVHGADLERVVAVHIQPTFGWLADKCRGIVMVDILLKDGQNIALQRVVQFTEKEMVDFASWFASTNPEDVLMYPKIHAMHKKDVVDFLTKYTR